jgi:hypothetical protein
MQDAPLLAHCRQPILIATIYMLFRGQDTRISPRELRNALRARRPESWGA